MHQQEAGPLRLAEDFYLLGYPATPVFLWDGPEPVLFEGGFACLAPVYLEQARQVLGERAPAWLLISHVHYDHCGAAGWFQEAWPGLKIAAAPKAARIIERPNAIKLISQLSQMAAEFIATLRQAEVNRAAFRPFTLSRTLEDGEVLALAGDRRVEVLATPGHTWDMLSYYLPQIKTLLASETVGTQSPEGYITSEFLVSYKAYVASIERLVDLDLELLCQGHHLMHQGQEAHEFIANSLAAAQQFKDWTLRLLEQEHGNQEKVVELVRMGEYDPLPQPKQPLPAYMLNLQARVKCLAEEFGAAA